MSFSQLVDMDNMVKDVFQMPSILFFLHVELNTGDALAIFVLSQFGAGD